MKKRGDFLSADKWNGWKIGNLRHTYEPILWFTKPYKIGGTIADNMIENEVGAYNEQAFMKYSNDPNNIISISSGKNDVGLHPTQKPLKLMQALIELTTLENQVVLDPFCGSGTTLLAAEMLQRRYIGMELNKNYYDIAKERLQKYKSLNECDLFTTLR